ncbi:unnamed protein product [Zymoseptoria tritici ST99CH_3D1]|nr:unnamed protein product [Zymoseptoria tritici ST99CH_3D1]
MISQLFVGAALAVTASSRALSVRQSSSDVSPGYSASNVEMTAFGLTADLTLAGPATNTYGNDIENLKLTVNYDTEKRLHVKIEDAPTIAYQVPISVFPTPDNSSSVSADASELNFTWEESPFSFRVIRKANSDVLFDSSASELVFQDQYLRLRTALPANPNLYGLGEHTDPFRLNATNYTRTMWSRDSYGVPPGTNLYGNHPIYFDHRGANGTHGVFLLSSSGMDVKINQSETGEQYLEYNLMSGVLDLYFMAGPTPTEVSKQYAEIAGLPAMMPYWGFGLHQCRYGYRDYLGVAEVVANYSVAGIPLETMWTDIDYMYERYIMTTDPDRYPIARVRDIVDYLHDHDQHYVVMVDPAVAYQEQKFDNLTYTTFTDARDDGLFLYKNDDIFKGVVWPGVTAFPDWFHPKTQDYWTNEFLQFFNADTGVDIDALWIDMNEAANFNHFGDDVDKTAAESGFPPSRPALRSQPRQIPGFPSEFQPGAQPYPADDLAYAPPWLAPASNPNDVAKRQITGEAAQRLAKRQAPSTHSGASMIGYADRDLLAPPYQIKNANTQQALGGLSNSTLDTDIVHYDGHVELDVHNLYGSMMSTACRTAMLARRPARRPLIITRSTFAGAGTQVGKWLGDNLSTWEQYRFSIAGMLNFAALFQMPMVGSDICGFGANTTETLCARWATLGAFYTFMRNHNGDTSIPQEFYLWDTVAEAARSALDIRYRLLDYIYTALHKQTKTGTPVANPMFFIYPNDTNTFGTQLQFFYGESILVSPVTEENSTSVDIYLPDDRFYAWGSWDAVEGKGEAVTLNDIGFTEIPLHVRGGSVLPVRAGSGITTTATRKFPFNIVIAPGRDGKASGSLYLDDGDSIEQAATSEITFTFEDGLLSIGGTFGYTDEEFRISGVTLLGCESARGAPAYQHHNGKKRDAESWTAVADGAWSEDLGKGVRTAQLDEVLTVSAAATQDATTTKPLLPGIDKDCRLGPLIGWPEDLRAYALTIASVPYPAALLWEDDFLLLHNDAWENMGGITAQGQPQRDSFSKSTLETLRSVREDGMPEEVRTRDLIREITSESKKVSTCILSPLQPNGIMIQLLPKPRMYQSMQIGGGRPDKVDYSTVMNDDTNGDGDHTDSQAGDNIPIDEHPFFRRFAEMLPSGLAILDRNAQAIFVNQHFFDLTTLQRDDEEFTSWPQSIHPEDYDRVMGAYKKAFQSQEQLRIEFRARDEPHPWRLLLLTPLGDENFQHVSTRDSGGFICSIVDISSEKGAELAERKAAQQARERKEQQERFIDMISHEIRNPLSAVLHCAEDITDAISGDKTETDISMIREAVETIHLCVKHQKNIVDDVLSFSKLDASLLSLVPTPSEPSRQLQVTLKMFQHEFRKEQMGFEYTVDDSYNSAEVNRVMADIPRIGQVLINLVTNAIKFTQRSKGEKKLTCSVGASLKRPDSYPPNVVFFESENSAYRIDATNTKEWGSGEALYIMVAVKDTGIGISQEGQRRLFERFRQATPKTEEVYGGSGLGLNISRKICHLHGGEIGVSSKEGEGSTFGFFFKVKRTEDNDRESTSPQEEQNGIERIRGQIHAELHSPVSPHGREPFSYTPRAATKPEGSSYFEERPTEEEVDGPAAVDYEKNDLYGDAERPSISKVHLSGESKVSDDVTGNKSAEHQLPSRPKTQRTGSKAHVLLVEDNVINQRIVFRKLEAKGFNVTTANNGKEAVDAARNAPRGSSGDKGAFDIILMDQEMPIMDGNAATKAIRELEERGEVERVPILGVTANVRGAQQEEMLNNGMDDVISKPYMIEEMVTKINEVVGYDAREKPDQSNE